MSAVTYGVHLSSNRQAGNSPFKLSRSASRYIPLVLFALIAMLYIAQSTQSSTKQLALQTIQTEQSTVSTQQNQLQLEATRLQSLKAVSTSADSQKLTPVTDVEYLAPTPATTIGR